MMPGAFEITPDQWHKLRTKALDDPWSFSELILRDNRAVERIHKPMLYLMTGEATRFMDCMRLPEYQSTLMDSAVEWCVEHEINLATDAGEDELHRIIGTSGVNVRFSRSFAKTTYASVGRVWKGTKNPDVEIGIASKSDPAARKLMAGMAAMIKGEEYGFFFPERVPDTSLRDLVNSTRIWMEGRTKYMQSTMEGRGLLSQWTGGHYDEVWGDDIVGTESGEASMEDSLVWIAALRGISKARILGGTWRLFTGTMYDDGDDHSAAHVNDATLLSVIMPIWIKPEYDFDHLMDDGVPTMPEWFDVEEIREMRKQTLAGPGGPISWLNNFEMTTLSSGQKRINREILKRQTLVVERDENGREVMMRPDADGMPVRVFLSQIDQSCGLDQAMSEAKHADEWVFGLAGQDNYGHRYLLDGVSGKGYEKMLAAVMPSWFAWDAPVRVGIDTTGIQVITTDLIKREPAFQQILSSLVPVSSSNVSKAVRITTYIVAGLRSGKLWIHPRLLDFIRQAGLWNPDSPRAKQPGTDDWLDAMSIALEVLRSVPISDEDFQRMEFVAYSNRERSETAENLAEEIGAGIDYFEILGMGDDF